MFWMRTNDRLANSSTPASSLSDQVFTSHYIHHQNYLSIVQKKLVISIIRIMSWKKSIEKVLLYCSTKVREDNIAFLQYYKQKCFFQDNLKHYIISPRQKQSLLKVVLHSQWLLQKLQAKPQSTVTAMHPPPLNHPKWRNIVKTEEFAFLIPRDI